MCPMLYNSMLRILTIAALAMTPICLFGQGNFPFPTGYAEWQWITVSPVIGPNDEYTQIRNFIEGDTIFEGKQYSKAYRQTLCRCFCPSTNAQFSPAANQSVKLIGGVREEAGKVYFSTFGQAPFNAYLRPVVDTLLFDFTLGLGDTLVYGGHTLTVTEISMTTEGRKRINLMSLPGGIPKQASWTEGIGDVGLLESISRLEGSAFYTGNSCFSAGQPSSCTVRCALSTAISEPETVEHILIYPSFARETANIEVGDGFSGITLQVFSADGRLHQSIRHEANTLVLNLRDWPAGLYHFVFEKTSGQRVSRRYVR